MKKHFSTIALTSLIVSACGLSSSPDDHLGETSQALGENPLAGRPMSGTWSTTSGTDGDSTVCRECSYTNAANYGEQSYPQNYSIVESWSQQFPRLGASAGLPDAFNAADDRVDDILGGEFSQGLDRNLCVAYTMLAMVKAVSNTGELNPPTSTFSDSPSGFGLRSALESLPNPIICEDETWQHEIASAILSAPSAWRRFFPPEYARHLKSQISPNGLGYTTHTYAEPQCLAEMDGRGARSYCAMREAATAAGGHARDLGSHTHREFAWWDVGDVNGKVRLLPQERIVSGNSEVFVMPLVTGGGVNPLVGPLFPRFVDLTHPLVWVSGDSKYESPEAWGRVGTTWSGTFPNLKPTPLYGWTKRYDNMAHGDYLAGVQRTGSLGLNNVEFFRVWEILSVGASLHLDLELGTLKDPHPLEAGSAPTRSVNLDPVGGSLFASDGPIHQFNPSTGTIPAYYQSEGRAGLYPPVATVASQFGTRVRYDQRDDRTAVVRDKISETLTLTGSAGVNIAGVTVGLNVNSSATVSSQLDTVFREHLSGVVSSQTQPVAGAANQLALQSNAAVSVERRSDIIANPFNIVLTFAVVVETPFGDINFAWDKELYAAPTIDDDVPETFSSEAAKLRVGQFGQNGLTAFDRDGQRPSVYSHLPAPNQAGGQRFQSFPQTVGQCLATDGNVPDADPPEDPQPPQDFDPAVCLVTYGDYSTTPGGSVGLPQRIPTDVCDGANRVGFINDYMSDCTGTQCAEERTCMEEFVNFTCAEGGLVSWDGVPVHSREVEAQTRSEFVGLAAECAELHASRGSSAADARDLLEEFHDLYTLALCVDGVPTGSPHQ